MSVVATTREESVGPWLPLRQRILIVDPRVPLVARD